MARIGLVLGGGGIIGAAYMVGALEGLRRVTGWEPHHSELIVGTSAGAFIGSIVTSGIPAWALYALCTDEVPPEREGTLEVVERARGLDRHNEGTWLRRFPPPRRIPRPLFAGPRLVLKGIAAPRRTTLEMFVSGLLGDGLFSLRCVREIVRGVAPSGWPDQRLWVTACDLDSGRRVAFSREATPGVTLDDAVLASSAVPGLFAPAVIGGRRYVDGGCWSTSNLDLVVGTNLDAVICITPLSGAQQNPRGLLSRLGNGARARVDRRLAGECRKVENDGIYVHSICPTAADLDAIPLNHMDLRKRPAVMRRAARTTEEALLGDSRSSALVALLAREARAAHAAAEHDPHPLATAASG